MTHSKQLLSSQQPEDYGNPWARVFPRISLIFLMGWILDCPLRAEAQVAVSSSVGVRGINAQVLHQSPYQLLGRKIGIGQVEIGRPGLLGFDKISLRNRSMLPAAVFAQDQRAKKDQDVDAHAHNVAALMISQDKVVLGVAPQARLYATAVGQLGRSGQPEECRSTNFIALQNGGDVRAINFSFGESLGQDPRPNAVLDGNALLTQCIDWSARVHDVVYVIAGNQGDGGIPIPTDNFNGLNVAFTRRDRGVFRKVDFANLGNELAGVADRREGRERNLQGRRSIALVAPGSQMDLLNPDGTITQASGTSFAAPHVTATIALLQEYSDRRLVESQGNPTAPQWSAHSRRHEVMRAVLINSADKMEDPGDGRYLGMSHTILNQQGKTWLDSEAYQNVALPLDLQMGSGQLNAFRAYQQLSAGQQSPAQPVGAIGWDYQSIEATGSFQDYVFATPLQGGMYLAATLAWDRWVDLNDRNGDGEFQVGESFSDRGLNNLDLYLMPAEAKDVKESLWSSVSAVDSFEHLFFRIPSTGRYKLRVSYRDQVHSENQAYGLAWWGVFSP